MKILATVPLPSTLGIQESKLVVKDHAELQARGRNTENKVYRLTLWMYHRYTLEKVYSLRSVRVIVSSIGMSMPEVNATETRWRSHTHGLLKERLKK